MKKLIFTLLALFFSLNSVFAETVKKYENGFWQGQNPDWTALNAWWVTLIWFLSIIQTFLLKVVLPVIVIGSSLWIAYQLLTAEGDETKMKQAWKSVTFSAIALMAIALSYAFVSIISKISF